MSNTMAIHRRAIVVSRALWIPGLVLAVVSNVYGSIAFQATDESAGWISPWTIPLAHLVCTIGVVALLSGAILRRAIASSAANNMLWPAGCFALSGLVLYNLALGFEDQGTYDAGRIGMELPFDLVVTGMFCAPIAFVAAAVLGLIGLVTTAKRRRSWAVGFGLTAESDERQKNDARSWRGPIVLGRCLWISGLTITVLQGSWGYSVYNHYGEYPPTSLDIAFAIVGQVTLSIGFILMLSALAVSVAINPRTRARSIAWVALGFVWAGYATLYLAWVGAEDGDIVPADRTTGSAVGLAVVCVAGIVAWIGVAYTRESEAEVGLHI